MVDGSGGQGEGGSEGHKLRGEVCLAVFARSPGLLSWTCRRAWGDADAGAGADAVCTRWREHPSGFCVLWEV